MGLAGSVTYLVLSDVDNAAGGFCALFDLIVVRLWMVDSFRAESHVFGCNVSFAAWPSRLVVMLAHPQLARAHSDRYTRLVTQVKQFDCFSIQPHVC